MEAIINHCTACGKKLEPEFSGPDFDPASEQWDNALEIQFNGGYGMFIDPFDRQYRAIICHECAHDLCDKVPWIGRLLDPSNSHSHSAWKRDSNGQAHTVDWTGHQGFDLPHEPLSAA